MALKAKSLSPFVILAMTTSLSGFGSRIESHKVLRRSSSRSVYSYAAAGMVKLHFGARLNRPSWTTLDYVVNILVLSCRLNGNC